MAPSLAALNGITESFDYVICGGGTAGCVLAARLAEDEQNTVLLIEAGLNNKGVDDVDMALGAINLLGTDNDWNLETVKNPNLNDRKIKTSRGRFLGGSSGCNGTVCTKGTRQDFDDWNQDGWGGDEMFQYMCKAETFQPETWFDADSKSHGDCGPLRTEAHELAPISKLVMQSFQYKGLPYVADMFSSGKTAHGCGHTARTISQGTRTTAADYLARGSSPKNNITIKTSTLVDQILFETESDGLVAAGVRTITRDGARIAYRASKEVIISGGAYCSPAMLMRSGIGPKEELLKHSIECKVDLPGVGSNLIDHPIVWLFYETNDTDLTIDKHIHYKDSLTHSYTLWKGGKGGYLSRFPFGSYALARLEDRLAEEAIWKNATCEPGRDPMGLDPKSQANVEFFNSECYFGPKGAGTVPLDGQNAFGMGVILLGTKSQGTVRLASPAPEDALVVDHNYLSDPLELLILAEACKLANEIVTEGEGTRNAVKGSWPPSSRHHEFTSREQWTEYVRANATTCYHPAGTCRMGQSDDPMAVLDERLCVRGGVKRLRVVDASIMPSLTNGHPQMPIYGIAEKAADLIKEDLKKWNE